MNKKITLTGSRGQSFLINPLQVFYIEPDNYNREQTRVCVRDIAGERTFTVKGRPSEIADKLGLDSH